MGYCISLVESKFHIKAANKKPALKAIKALAKDTSKMRSGTWADGALTQRRFTWVDTEEFLGAKTLEAALEAWRWEAGLDEETGDVVHLNFQGEKMGEDEELWKAIAPFVESGSYLQISGEDGATWRWCFKGGVLSEQSPSWGA
jgi:hypothetical protein